MSPSARLVHIVGLAYGSSRATLTWSYGRGLAIIESAAVIFLSSHSLKDYPERSSAVVALF